MNAREKDILWAEILHQRITQILPSCMREKKVEAWLVLSEEFNEDPLFRCLSLYGQRFSKGLSAYLFIEKNGESRAYAYGNKEKHSPYKPMNKLNESFEESLIAILKHHDIREVLIQVSKDEPIASGLSCSLYKRLVTLKNDNPFFDYRNDQNLSIAFMSTRGGLEKKWMIHLSQQTEDILETVMTAENIRRLGNTRNIQYALLDESAKRGFLNWFSPDVDLQRKGASSSKLTDEDIAEGDLIHVDFGIEDQLSSDVQRLYYRGQHLPEAFERGHRQALRLQDIIVGAILQAEKGNEALAKAQRRALEEGIMAEIYTHPLGFHGHGLGAAVGRYHSLGKPILQGRYPIFKPALYAVESNAAAVVEAWGHQKVHFFTEEDVWFEGEAEFLSHRQTQISLR